MESYFPSFLTVTVNIIGKVALRSRENLSVFSENDVAGRASDIGLRLDRLGERNIRGTSRGSSPLTRQIAPPIGDFHAPEQQTGVFCHLA